MQDMKVMGVFLSEVGAEKELERRRRRERRRREGWDERSLWIERWQLRIWGGRERVFAVDGGGGWGTGLYLQFLGRVSTCRGKDHTRLLSGIWYGADRRDPANSGILEPVHHINNSPDPNSRLAPQN